MIFFLIFSFLVSCVKKSSDQGLLSRWDPQFSPLLFLTEFDNHLRNLPLQGHLDPKDVPYPAYYWPKNQAQLAQRWREFFLFGIWTKSFEFVFGEVGDLNNLSAAEKYDLYLGRKHFPFAQKERQNSHPDRAVWEGLCHGHGPAALNFCEPDPVTVTLEDGRSLTFFSSDLKGLLAYLQSLGSGRTIQVLGRPCPFDLETYDDLVQSPCRDLNPAALHLILTSEIGLKKRGFVADLDQGSELWNYPVQGYQMTLKEKRDPHDQAALGTVEERHVQVVIQAAKFVDPTEKALLPDYKEVYEHRADYWLELDEFQRIIGGSWFPETERVDNVWRQDRPDFTGEWAPLGELYRLSVEKKCPHLFKMGDY